MHTMIIRKYDWRKIINMNKEINDDKTIEYFEKIRDKYNLNNAYEAFIKDTKENGYNKELLKIGAILNSFYPEYSIIKDLKLKGLSESENNEKTAEWFICENDKYIILDREKISEDAIYVKDKIDNEIVDDSMVSYDDALAEAGRLNNLYETDQYEAYTEKVFHYQFTAINLRTGEEKIIDQFDALPGRLPLNELSDEIAEMLEKKYCEVAEKNESYAKYIKNSIDVIKDIDIQQREQNRFSSFRNKKR